MTVAKIEYLEDLLKGINGQITDQKITRLTAPGENFGSVMLKVDLKISDGNQEKSLHAVAKLLPNEMFQEIFNSQVTFKNEIGWYTTIVPTLRKFQEEQGMEETADFFPELLGARISLDPKSDRVDSGAVLLLENIIISGYKNIDRLVGFDLPTSKIILRDLAILHAVPMAIKLKNPQLFQEKIKPFLAAFNPPQDPEVNNKFIAKILKATEENTDCVNLVPRIKEAMNQENGVKELREPWVTVTHNDCWVNNIMIKFEDGKPPKCKFVDFQIFEYQSPLADVVFFLMTSVHYQVLETHFDELLKYYYDGLIQNLKQLNVESDLFPFEDFLKELDAVVKGGEIKHIMFLMSIVYAERGTFEENFDFKTHEEPEPTLRYKQQLWYCVKEAAKRNWI